MCGKIGRETFGKGRVGDDIVEVDGRLEMDTSPGNCLTGAGSFVNLFFVFRLRIAMYLLVHGNSSIIVQYKRNCVNPHSFPV